MIHAGVADSRQWNNEFSYSPKGIKSYGMACEAMEKANLCMESSVI
jgi:hypothetical protein